MSIEASTNQITSNENLFLKHTSKKAVQPTQQAHIQLLSLYLKEGIKSLTKSIIEMNPYFKYSLNRSQKGITIIEEYLIEEQARFTKFVQESKEKIEEKLLTNFESPGLQINESTFDNTECVTRSFSYERIVDGLTNLVALKLEQEEAARNLNKILEEEVEICEVSSGADEKERNSGTSSFFEGEVIQEVDESEEDEKRDTDSDDDFGIIDDTSVITPHSGGSKMDKSENSKKSRFTLETPNQPKSETTETEQFSTSTESSTESSTSSLIDSMDTIHCSYIHISRDQESSEFKIYDPSTSRIRPPTSRPRSVLTSRNSIINQNNLPKSSNISPNAKNFQKTRLKKPEPEGLRINSGRVTARRNIALENRENGAECPALQKFEFSPNSEQNFEDKNSIVKNSKIYKCREELFRSLECSNLNFFLSETATPFDSIRKFIP